MGRPFCDTVKSGTIKARDGIHGNPGMMAAEAIARERIIDAMKYREY